MNSKSSKIPENWHPDDLLDNTAFLVIDIGRLMRRRFDHKMALFGLPRPEWFLLAHLWFFDGSTQQELADTLDVTKGGMAKLIARMEEKGLIERESESRDGRAIKRVLLTKMGRTLASKVDAASVNTVAEFVRPLTRQQTEGLHDLLRRLRTSLLGP